MTPEDHEFMHNWVPPSVRVGQALEGVNLPLSRQDLLKAAEDNGADSDVIAILNAMPDDTYHTISQVMAAAQSVPNHTG